MKEIRSWDTSQPGRSDREQSALIDRLIQSVLLEHYPFPQWLLTLDLERRQIHVSKWVQGGDKLWGPDGNSPRFLECRELEAAGVKWLALAQSQLS